MDALSVIAVIGGIALLAGLFGGITAKDLTIAPLPAPIRILSSVMGIVLIVVVVWRLSSSQPTSTSTQTGSVLPTTTFPSTIAIRSTDVVVFPHDTSVPSASEPPTHIPPAPSQVPSVSPPTADVTLEALQTKCAQLRARFPQNLEEIKVKFNLPDSKSNKFRLVTELCPGVANGFMLQDAVTEFHLEVPSGGCIDAWSGDTHFEGDVGTPVPDGHEGWRVSKGTVYTYGMTYRVANCENT